MSFRPLIAVPAVALALVAGGCGGSSSNDSAGVKPGTSTSDPQSVKNTILTWTFEGACDVMTDRFLEQQAVFGNTRQQRCAYLAKTFHKPSYSPGDVKFRSVKITGSRATAVIGSDISNAESTYTLVLSGGKWQIDDAS